ncbi:hypothetical protein SERLADRAFT_465639 [Serpula lacrymans var. lacrymans S7.9]|nr:uncharacterized protein SERLADRAFT_465639 [Serpula lacrymans var. lacrymans S7.9]EGO25454.1 hypothetical protein SERLADRAFT_465639 [Serpula lacrymans var. lacrymans S7.9]
MVLCFFLLRGNVKVGQSAHRLPTLSVEKETVLQKILRIDWVGTLFFVGGGILILLALNWGSTNEWGSARVIVSWIIGGLLFVACILWEYILEHQMFSINPSSISVLRADPMLPLEIFRSYDVSTVEYGSFISGLVMLVMFYFVSIFMTIVTGLSPAKAGVQLVYFAPGMGGGTLISIFMIRHLRQPKYPIIFGSIVITVSLGLIQMAMNFNNQNQVNGFMVMSGVGVGLTAGSLAVHARFSQPTNRVAIVNALTLFFRSLGGTVGLAQCAAVMNAKVTRYLTAQIRSGTLSASDISALAAASANGGLDSLQSLGGLPTNVQNVVRDAFRNGVRWSFISLIPWCGLAVIFTLFLSNIRDRKGENKQAETGQAKEKVSHIDSGQNISNHEQVHGEEQVAPVTGS